MSSSWNSSPSSAGEPSVGAYMTSNDDHHPPPPPPKPYRSPVSPQTGISPTSSNHASPMQSSGWVNAQPFANGRGHVPTVAAPRAFQPPPAAAPSRPPPLAPPLQGQQAYLRAPEPSATSSAALVDGGTAPAPISFPSAFGTRQRVAIKSSRPQFGRGAGRVGAAMTSRQNMPRREGSNGATIQPPSPNLQPPPFNSGRASPQHVAPRGHAATSTGEDSRGTTTMAPGQQSPTASTSALESVLGSGNWADEDNDSPDLRSSRTRTPSPNPQFSSVLDRPRPKTPDPFGGAGSGSFASRPLEVDYAPLSATSSNYERRSPTPSSTSISMLDRPRPRTPDPFASSASSSPAHSPVALVKTQSSGAGPAMLRPSFSRADSTPSVNSAQTLSAERDRNGSVIDRPRPKTPEAGALFAFGGGHRGHADPPPRAKTPEPSTLFGFGGSEEGQGSSAVYRERQGSMMDRPRPRTPDPQSWLDQAQAAPVVAPPRVARPEYASRHSFSRAPEDTNVKSSRIPLASPPLSQGQPTFPAPSRQQSRTAASLPALPLAPSSLASAALNRPSTDSQRTRTESGSSLSNLLRRSSESMRSNNPSPKKGTAAQHASSRSRFASVGAAPMLRLDLDLGGSETMFDIASLLKAGGGSTGYSPVKREFSEVDRGEREKDLPLPAEHVSSAPNRPTAMIPRTRKESIPAEAQATAPTHPSTVIEEEDEAPATTQRDSSELAYASSSPAPKRRKSVNSLVSYSSSAKHDSTGTPLPTHRSSDSITRPSTEQSRPSYDSAAPSQSSDYHQSGMSTSTSATSALSQSQSSTQSHATLSSTTTAGTGLIQTKRPSAASLDKSLPPTPASQTPTTPTQHRARQASLAQAVAAAPLPPPLPAPSSPSLSITTDSPTKGSLGRQLSKLRNRNHSHSGASAIPANPSLGFHFVSSNSTRKGTSFSFGGSNRSASGGSLSGPAEPSALSSKSPTPTSGSTTATLGRRLVERFGGGSSSIAGGSKSPSSTAQQPMDSTTDSPTPETPKRRRASFSNLLGGQSRPTVSEAGVVEGQRTKILGMSLPAGRKSADMLATRRQWDGTQRTEGSEPRPAFVGRQSFDLLTQGDSIPRRPSTDDLLTLATARLASLDTNDDSADPAGSTTSQPRDSMDSVNSVDSTMSSDLSTTSLELDHQDPVDADEPEPVLSTATRVLRSGSTVSLEPAADSPDLGRSATPKLVRSESLRRSDSNNTMLSAGTTQGPASDGHASRSDEVTTPKQSHSPTRSRRRGRIHDSGLGSVSTMSSAWLELEESLAHYSTAVSENRLDRGHIVANALLPFLRREEDRPGPRPDQLLAQRQRDVLFKWLSVLTGELRDMQPSHRGACLEAVAAISESHFLSAAALHEDAEAEARYRTAIVRVLAFAVDKLNDKAVYANTLVFSGRIFALAFFRIEGVALKLLRALPPVKKQCLKRVLDEVGVNEHQLPQVDLEAFPPHLWPLCLRDLRSYQTLLLPPPRPRTQTEDDGALVRDDEITVEMTGNWLIRWTASDSDLPFAFYRAYHRQLAAHLVPFEARHEVTDIPLLAPESVITAPGALFLAASLLEKSDSLVHRNLRSVTSIGPNTSTFNTNDSANLSFGQKPKILELANRRLVQTMLDIVGGPPVAPGDQADLAPDSETRRHAFSRMLRVWIRACVKKTSMWDTRSVFILLDLVEGLIYTLSYPAPTVRGTEEDIPVPKPQEACIDMFDLPFIFSFVKIILASADNTVTLMRTIAFIYAHFEIFTLRPADRDELCESIILDEVLFPRLYLHWNAGVRGYFIRLLVWRLSRLGIVDAEQHPDRPRDPRILALFGLMNLRLEAIRKRHDELEPMDTLTDDDLFKPKRSTICSTRGVKEAPFTVDELVGTLNEDSEDDQEEFEEPQELVQSAPNGSSVKKSGLKDVASVARVVSWLKGGLSKSNKNKSSNSRSGLSSRIDPFILGNLPESPSAQLDDPAEAMETSELSESSHQTTWTAQSMPTSVTDECEPDVEPTITVVDSTPERRIPRPNSPAFFSFEFESGLTPRDEAEAILSSGRSTSGSVASTGSGDTVFPRSSLRRSASLEPGGAINHRVSLRFSKRISILPPAALDMLKESGEAVPPIPAQYRQAPAAVYDRRLHPYAIRGLRDYEDALDEWTDWVARLQEEEDDGKKFNRGFVDTVPRLAVAWPASFAED